MLEDDLKTALAEGHVIFGTRRVMKLLKTGALKTVVVANNCPEEMKKDVLHNAKLASIHVETFNGTGKNLGLFCGKPFLITTLGIKGKKVSK